MWANKSTVYQDQWFPICFKHDPGAYHVEMNYHHQPSFYQTNKKHLGFYKV